MALDYKNRLVPDPLDRDAIRDSDHSSIPGSGTGAVSICWLQDPQGNKMALAINITSVAIDPNADTTYDSLPVNSLFVDGVGAQLYIKSSATAWTAAV